MDLSGFLDLIFAFTLTLPCGRGCTIQFRYSIVAGETSLIFLV